MKYILYFIVCCKLFNVAVSMSDVASDVAYLKTLNTSQLFHIRARHIWMIIKGNSRGIWKEPAVVYFELLLLSLCRPSGRAVKS
jgi:hypothetical protein